MHLNPPGAPFPPPPDLPHVHTPVNPLANPSSGDVLFAHTFAPMIGGGGTASASGGSGTVTSITLTQPAAGLTITGSGTPITTTGTPTFALANDLAALEALASTGLAARTGADAWAQRTITGTAGTITVTNGSGAAGDPTITIAATYVGQSSITTLGTIATGVWNGTAIGVANGGTGRSSHTEWAVLCGGTTTTAAQQSVASVGTSGQVLTSNGAGAFPTFQSLAVATQADQETATDVAKAVTPGRQHFHPSAAKAWVLFDASSGTPSILASRNVTSITDGGVGIFTVNFTTAFSSTSYVAVGMCSTPGTTNGKITEGAGRTASAFPMACLPDGGGTFDASRIMVAFFGDQ